MPSLIRYPRPADRSPSAGTSRAAVLAVALAAALLLPLAPAFAQADDWCWDDRDARHCEVRELTMDTRDGRLSVDAGPNGGITVRGWDSDYVRVEARLTAQARTDAAAMELAEEVEVRAEPGRLSSEGPRTRGRESWSVSFRVWAPVGTDVDLETTNGGLEVTGVAGAVEARTTNGSIRLSDLDGSVRAQSTNGALDASFRRDAQLLQNADLRTTNGGVTLAIAEGTSARLEASTTNGSISTDFPITVQGRIDKNLSAVLGNGGPEIRVRTTNGSIRIRRN